MGVQTGYCQIIEKDGSSPYVGVRKSFPEDGIQRVTLSWPTEAAEGQRIGGVKSIAGPRNNTVQQLGGGMALNEGEGKVR